MSAPRLLTFDVFGTVLDWRRGLSEAAARAGHPLAEGDFDRIVDRQGAIEQQPPFRGLTTVFVRRPHARPGQADHQVSDLLGLATLVEELP
jgi:FMN phosphatase YigB (HAD superfamily)